jgi:hypothetical protein
MAKLSRPERQFTFTNGATESAEIDISDLQDARLGIVGIKMGASWTANTGRLQYNDGSGWMDIYDEYGSVLSFVIGGASRYIALRPALYAMLEGRIRVALNSATGGARVASLIMRPV